ncbi:Ig-like domain-containing protein, partial [Acinetobacter sp. YH12110]
MSNFIVIEKDSLNKVSVNAERIVLSESSIVHTKMNRDDVAEFIRDGNNLILKLKNGEVVVIENFFVVDAEGVTSDLVFEEDGCVLYWFDGLSGFKEISGLEALLPAVEGSKLVGLLPWLVGAAVVGGAAAIIDHNNDDDKKTSDSDTTAPAAPTDVDFSDDGSTITGKGEPGANVVVKDEDGNIIGEGTVDEDGHFEVDLDEPLTNGEEVTVGLVDEAGNKSPEVGATAPDTTAPEAPTAEFNEDGSEVSGTAEPGSTVQVKDKDGNVLGTAEADEDGNYTVELEDPLNDGEVVDVTATDAANNESDPTEAVAPDTTAPDAPTDVEFSDDGSTITGKGEPGANVVVKDEDGNIIGEGTVDEDGNFEVELEEPLTNGEEVTVGLVDDAGNESPEVDVTAPDTTAPEAPTAAFNEDGSEVSGTAEPGSTVTVKDKDGNVLGTAVTDEDGNYTVELENPLNDGEVVDVTATDASGNESAPTEAVAPDTTAPDAPTAEFNEDGSEVSGTAEPGSTVTVKDKDGNVLGTAEADEDGNYTVELEDPLNDGEVVDVTATDASGNESAPTEAVAPDTTAPDAPTAEFNEDGSEVSGTAEPGSTVTVKDKEGNVLGTAEADEDGNYTVELENPLNDGEVVDVTATDASGNESAPTEAVAPDTTAPEAPTAEFNEDGSEVSGTAEPGSTVQVKDKDGNVLGTAEADEDGNYTVELEDPLNDGEVVDVTATDASGNESAPTEAVAPDTTAPDAPTADVVNDGTQVTGTAEPGSTVTVKDQNGNVLGTAVTDENGNYTVDLTTPLTNGEVVDVTATDAAGNESDPTQATADDTTAPTAPTADVVNDGTQVTGTAEPGSTVTVKDQNGNVLGTAVTDENGNYTVDLTTP